MNKKIRAVVKNYEKNMKFESKFEQLSHKLDLIKDDTPLKSDVIVIRRKLIPAYMMSILVMALVTGLIGLQIGLGNLKIKTEYVNPVRVELEQHVDIYLPNSVYSDVIGDKIILNFYIGKRNDQSYILINITSRQNEGSVTITYNNQQYVLMIEKEDPWAVIQVSDTDVLDLEINYIDEFNQVYNQNELLDFTNHFEYLNTLFN